MGLAIAYGVTMSIPLLGVAIAALVSNGELGTPTWPAYALRSLGLFAAVAAVLVLLGGIVQINPIWQWGPYELDRSTNGAQPDWYLGWLIGGLRLMPPLEIRVFGHTLVPNPFWGGVFFPTLVFAVLGSCRSPSLR